MDTVTECVIEWIKGDKTVTVSMASNTRLNNKVRKLAENFQDDVDILENLDGSICAHVPLSWIKISPPKKMSDENKKNAVERLNNYRKERNHT